MGHPSGQVSMEPTGCSLTAPPGHYPAWQPAERGSERETEKKRSDTLTITGNQHFILVIQSCINPFLSETGLYDCFVKFSFFLHHRVDRCSRLAEVALYCILCIT